MVVKDVGILGCSEDTASGFGREAGTVLGGMLKLATAGEVLAGIDEKPGGGASRNPPLVMGIRNPTDSNHNTILCQSLGSKTGLLKLSWGPLDSEKGVFLEMGSGAAARPKLP